MRSVKVIRRVVAYLSAGLLVAAVLTELRKPSAERTWHGAVGGVVPYDFRVPRLSRVQHSLWDPENDRLLVPRSFGVGWSVNLAAVLRRVRQVSARPAANRSR